jgi:Sec-independent protein translocase protein TatA
MSAELPGVIRGAQRAFAEREAADEAARRAESLDEQAKQRSASAQEQREAAERQLEQARNVDPDR